VFRNAVRKKATSLFLASALSIFAAPIDRAATFAPGTPRSVSLKPGEAVFLRKGTAAAGVRNRSRQPSTAQLNASRCVPI